MARISGVDIPREKRLVISLTYIYGIGLSSAEEICAATGIDPSTRVRDLTDDEVNQLRAHIETNLKVEGDLRRDVSQNIKRKMEIGCYQGLRHRRGLPVSEMRRYTEARPCRSHKTAPARKQKLRK